MLCVRHGLGAPVGEDTGEAVARDCECGVLSLQAPAHLPCRREWFSPHMLSESLPKTRPLGASPT
jgi:hypothetical protein